MRYNDLIDRLIEKTEKGQAVWNKTYRDTEYALRFKRGKITIDRWTGEDYELVDLILCNERGEKINSLNFCTISGNMEYSKLIELYELVQRGYLMTDETVNSFFKELDEDGVIGERIYSARISG